MNETSMFLHDRRYYLSILKKSVQLGTWWFRRQGFNIYVTRSLQVIAHYNDSADQILFDSFRACRLRLVQLITHF